MLRSFSYSQPYKSNPACTDNIQTLPAQTIFTTRSVEQIHSVGLPRQQWSLLNRFRTEQGHCDACRRKWRLTDTDLCPCGETQTMSHIVESCPVTKLNGGLSRLHSADGGRCFVADQLWLMTRIREEEDSVGIINNVKTSYFTQLKKICYLMTTFRCPF